RSTQRGLNPLPPLRTTFPHDRVRDLSRHGVGPTESFGQSWRTVRGYGWPAFGTYVLVFLLWLASNLVLGLILVAVPTGIASSVRSIGSGTLVGPFFALVAPPVYSRLTAAHLNGAAAPAGGGYAQAPGGSLPPGTPPPASPSAGSYAPPTGGGAGQ